MVAQTAKRAMRKGNLESSVEPSPSSSAVVNWTDKLNQAIDELTESRSSTREEAYSNVIAVLSRHYCAEALENRNEELLALLKKSLSKGAKEACMSARVIALSFISHGDISLGEQEHLYQLIVPSLKRTLKHSDDCDVKINCLYTLTLITFLTASDIDRQLIRDFVFDLIETNGEEFNVDELTSTQVDQFMCAAVRGYGLLFAAAFCEGIVDFEVVWEEVEKVMPMHELLLESSDKDVRVATGENIALMFETTRMATAADGEDDEDDKVEQPEYDNMDELLHTLRGLSVDSNRRRNKNDRAEQRSAFRDIMKSIEEGVKPVEELKISGRVIPFKGWSKLLALNAIRRCIGQGLQHHLKTNDLLRQIFHYSGRFTATPQDSEDSDFDGDDYVNVTDMGKADRQYIYGESRKMRDKQLRTARRGKDRA